MQRQETVYSNQTVWRYWHLIKNSILHPISLAGNSKLTNFTPTCYKTDCNIQIGLSVPVISNVVLLLTLTKSQT